MAFTTDRDLLVLEPGVFRDAAWTAQRLVKGAGGIAATTLTLASGGPNFEDAAIGAGHVALIAGAPAEVVERTGPSSLTVSRPRADAADPPIPMLDDASVSIEVFTFAPVIASVHRRLLRMLGIEPDESGEEGALTEAAITNPGALVRLEALGALHEVYAAASAPGPVGTEIARRAEAYRVRFVEERHRVVARIDLDGDAKPDALRRFNVIQFVRG